MEKTFLFAILAQVSQPSDLQRIAVDWAPMIYAELAPEYIRPASGFSPVDFLVSIDFDRDGNYQNNGESVFRLSSSLENLVVEDPVVYYSVIETESHYYINYIFYHAIDLGPSPHSHDTENLWTVVEKKTNKLLFQISNAHGVAMLYSPDESRERRLRVRLPHNVRTRFMHLVDPIGMKHDSEGRPYYVSKAQGKSIKLFNSARTHSIYKWSPSVWSKENDLGIVYLPPRCHECFRENLDRRNPVKEYRLENIDAFILSEVEKLERGEITIEDWRKRFSSPEKLDTTNRWISLPTSLASPINQDASSGDMYYVTSLGFQSELIDPAAKHRWIENSSYGISSHYLNHPFLKPRRNDSRMSDLRRSGLFKFFMNFMDFMSGAEDSQSVNQ